MLGSSHCGLIDGLIIALDSDIIDHDGTIVATDCEEGGELGMEIKAHDSRLSCELELRVSGVLNGETADQTSVLLQEVIRTITDSEEIIVSRVPADGSDVLLS